MVRVIGKKDNWTASAVLADCAANCMSTGWR
jgi:hypothetical protein